MPPRRPPGNLLVRRASPTAPNTEHQRHVPPLFSPKRGVGIRYLSGKANRVPPLPGVRAPDAVLDGPGVRERRRGHSPRHAVPAAGGGGGRSLRAPPAAAGRGLSRQPERRPRGAPGVPPGERGWGRAGVRHPGPVPGGGRRPVPPAEGELCGCGGGDPDFRDARREEAPAERRRVWMVHLGCVLLGGDTAGRDRGRRVSPSGGNPA
mmetsp:Transcript_18382/g.39496  ORF Transcript_18382/g.39496 Transcript_18382/m.39496 type:complete len:207 (+) Transcript_18382:223-843(+)